jgi:hypothetical protein
MPPAGFLFSVPFFPLLHFVLKTLPSFFMSLMFHTAVFIQQAQHNHPCPRWVRTHNPSKQTALDPRLRPRGHWDRLGCNRYIKYLSKSFLMMSDEE